MHTDIYEIPSTGDTIRITAEEPDENGEAELRYIQVSLLEAEDSDEEPEE